MKLNMKPLIFFLIIAAIIAYFLFGYFNKINTYYFESKGKGKPSINKDIKFSSYWFSWVGNNPQYIYQNLCTIPDGVNIVYIAFALEREDNKGLTLQLSNYQNFKNDLATLKSRGTKVLISTGGANGTYPWLVAELTDEDIAKQYINFIKEANYDGIDFDVEKGHLDRIPNIVKLIKTELPNLMITLTIGSNGSQGIDANLNELAKMLYQDNNLSLINLMNYNQFNVGISRLCSYETLELNRNCYINNIITTTKQIEKWSKTPEDAKKLISNGIMIGYADDKKIVSPELTAHITNWLKHNGYGGIMTWGLNRDQPTCGDPGSNLNSTTGVTGSPIGAYTSKIISVIKQPSS